MFENIVSSNNAYSCLMKGQHLYVYYMASESIYSICSLLIILPCCFTNFPVILVCYMSKHAVVCDCTAGAVSAV